METDNNDVCVREQVIQMQIVVFRIGDLVSVIPELNSFFEHFIAIIRDIDRAVVIENFVGVAVIIIFEPSDVEIFSWWYSSIIASQFASGSRLLIWFL